nr:MAG: ORF1 [Torque teno midi virus]
MPFWWRRRRRPWFGRRYKRTYYKTRRRRYPRRRRRPNRSTYKRRRYGRKTRKRRGKVRRKKKFLTLKQWQPDSIVLCKIKGGGLLILGAEGRQYACYTNNKQELTPAKLPAGGGFGVEVYSLQYLYEEYIFHRNIWTKSNIFKDLCRYLKCKITFYRNPYNDFIVAYERQPPFQIDQYTFPACHPFMLLQSKHKKIILSKATKTNGKLKTTMHIKPPKQMITKWFFTADFSKAHLFLLKGAVANFNHAYIGGKHENDLTSLIALNLQFYTHGDWGASSTTGYIPNGTTATKYTYKYWKNNQEQTATLNFTSPTENVSYDKGYFMAPFLQAYELSVSGVKQAYTPCTFLRYNPNTDNGKNNKIWLSSSLTKSYDPPQHDDILIAQGMPLWLMTWGWLDYIKTMKHEDKGFINSYYMVVESPSLFTLGGASSTNRYVLIDRSFWQGKAPYNQTPTYNEKKLWFPLIKNQLESINAIVETGPYVPKLSQETYSSWELKYDYSFYFKWGGPQITDPKIEDPEKQPRYPVPDRLSKKIQIKNPEKNIPESILQAWDYRRGFIKNSAIKRIRENTQTDTDFEPDTESETPTKKKRLGAQLRHPQETQEKIQTCLQELCKESTYQEEETQTIQHLIQQQQQQQFKLKRNLLELLSDLKTKQRMLQLQTGILN